MKRFSYLLLAACFCLPLVGCGGDAAAPAADAPAAGGDAASEGEGSGTAAEDGNAAAGEGSGEKPAE